MNKAEDATDPATASHCSPKGNEDQPQATS